MQLKFLNHSFELRGFMFFFIKFNHFANFYRFLMANFWLECQLFNDEKARSDATKQFLYFQKTFKTHATFKMGMLTHFLLIINIYYTEIK